LRHLYWTKANAVEITIPPIEVFDLDEDNLVNLARLVRFFQELAKQGESYIYEAKLLIIGEGGAGKTSLCRKLQHTDAEMPKEHETTRGIEVQPWEFPLANGQRFRLNIWDFGGQEIYHATHQFF